MNSILKIVLCFGIVIFSCQPNKVQKTEFTTLLETTTGWNGDTLPKYPEGQPKITILKVIIPPYSKLDVHKHSVINAAVVLDGELMVVTETQDTLHAKAGDAFEELVNTWHYGINETKKPVELIVFYAGIEGGTNTILKN